MNVIVTKNLNGNLHDLRTYCNDFGLADYLVGWERLPGMQVTVALFRVPKDILEELNAADIL
jgi:hypothetical protein